MENLKQLKMSFRFFNTFYFNFLVFIIELFQAAFLLVFFFGLLATAKLRYSQKFTVLWVLKGRPLGTFYLARLASVLQPIWRKIYNTLSFSSLYEWTAYITITHNITYGYPE